MPGFEGQRFCRHTEGFTLPGAGTHYPPDLELEPIHTEIRLRVDIPGKSATGTVVHTVVAHRNGSRRLALDAVDFSDLDVTAPDGGELSWTYDGNRLVVTWAEGFAAEATRRVSVSYRVERPVTGLFFSSPDSQYPDAPVFAATDNETERARHWLPSVDHPSVRPKLDFYLTGDERHEIVANGLLVAEHANQDGTKTAHWRLDARCPSYLTCFVMGELTRLDDGEFEGRAISYLGVASRAPEQLRLSFGRTREMLAWLTEKLGTPFPYPKYFQFAVPGIGGAMENISLVSWDDIFVLDETLAREWTWLLDQINIHEMAHSYFGDWIVCQDFAHAWLKESWATYIETCWLEDKRGLDESHYDFFANAHNYFGEADGEYSRPIVTRTYNHSWHMYDYHLYPGGACRLHTLRKLVGDEPFWAGVRDYVATYGGELVETDDFRRMIERHSGRSLGRFFDQWIYGAGYPHLKVSFELDEERSQGTFEIEQKQCAKTGKQTEGGTAFELELELAWCIGGVWHTQRVRFDEARHTAVVPMAADPTMVVLDPRGDVLFKLDFNPGDPKLRHQLSCELGVIARIRAARELCKTARDINIAAVLAAYRAEPFWGVRREMAKALGKAGVQSAADGLAELVGWEQDPMVMATLFLSAGKYRDYDVGVALLSRLQTDPDLPYLARAAAWEALGAQREGAPHSALVSACGKAGYHGIVQGGAMRGLAASRQQSAHEVLMAATEYGDWPHRVRMHAVKALGSLGEVLDKPQQERAIECLIDRLRDPAAIVRSASVGALEAIGSGQALAALDAHRLAVSAQERADVDRALAAIRATDSPKVAALEKHVESLEDKLQKLEAVVRKLEARDEARAKSNQESS